MANDNHHRQIGGNLCEWDTGCLVKAGASLKAATCLPTKNRPTTLPAPVTPRGAHRQAPVIRDRQPGRPVAVSLVSPRSRGAWRAGGLVARENLLVELVS